LSANILGCWVGDVVERKEGCRALFMVEAHSSHLQHGWSLDFPGTREAWCLGAGKYAWQARF
jgi:hypothetical protein